MFRERPRTRLSDRIRGKSGDEVFQELRQELDKDRKMFFDSNPNWGFTPAGSAFPRRHMFGDEDDLPTRGRTDLRSHLEDLANRHPEFADHLRSPPGWVSDFGGNKWSGGGSGSGTNRSHSRDRFFENQGQDQGQGHSPAERHEQQQEESPGEGAAAAPSRGDSLNQPHGLRNTVPDIIKSQAAAVNEARNQRSMSAPPDSNRIHLNQNNDKPQQQRFVSKIEINPVNPATGQTAADCSRPPVPPAKQPNMNQPQHKTSTVRHIPIFVEGRDEPILPKSVDQPEFAAASPPRSGQPHQQFTATHQFQPQPPTAQRKPSQPFHQQQAPHPQSFYQQAPPQHQSFHNQQQAPDQPDGAAAQHHHQQQHQQHQQQPQQQPPPEPKIDTNDPIYKVQLIQKEIDDLKRQIETFSCASRADKQYIYLDEMLTRNLLKLDNISTEGKENVRAVRKEAINSVQKCIGLLESKVATGEGETEGETAVEVEQQVEGALAVELPPVQNGALAATKEENGPMEKVPKTESAPVPDPASADNSASANEIKC